MKRLNWIILAALIFSLTASTAFARRYNQSYVSVNKYSVSTQINSIQAQLNTLSWTNVSTYHGSRLWRVKQLKRSTVARKAQTLKLKLKRLKNSVAYKYSIRGGNAIVPKKKFVRTINSMLKSVKSIQKANARFSNPKGIISFNIRKLNSKIWRLKSLVTSKVSYNGYKVKRYQPTTTYYKVKRYQPAPTNYYKVFRWSFWY